MLIVTSAWKQHQDFEVPLRITSRSPLAGVQMGVAGLLDLNFLFPIDCSLSPGQSRDADQFSVATCFVLRAYRSADGRPKPVDFNTRLAADDVIVFTGDLSKLANVMLEWNLVPEMPSGIGGHFLAVLDQKIG
eukprot:gene1807-2140_t